MKAALLKIIAILLFTLCFLQVKTRASDTLVVIFDRQQFVQGDSIEMEVYSEPFRANQPAQTLHLWIENVKTGQRWKYRYPFIKGRYKITLKINDSIANGRYAFNFLLQKKFLSVKGKLKNAGEPEKAINYIARTKNMAPIIDGVEIEEDGSFKIDNLFYTDSVYFGFSPVQKSKENKLKIAIETPLDSAFIPETLLTEFVTIGPDATVNSDAAEKGYAFSINDKKAAQLLQEIVLKTKQLSKREKYENENVSSLFASANARTFDFYENDELKNYPDIYSYLTANVAGLTSYNDEQTGRTVLYWRNQNVNIYVDEFFDADFSPVSLSVVDIELVKVYSPGSRMLDGFNGAVAIYTRRMSSRPGNRLSNYSFYVKGYTPKAAEWK
ncbi:MAG: hypothetical protein JNM14_08380 [Ferruginibacter sp.]|nr:hypothetical protein [Ferruginibacter sp.]